MAMGIRARWITGFGWLLLAALGSQTARANGFPADVGAGTLFVHSAGGYDTVAPLSTDVRISVAGIVARVAVAQRFRNTGSTAIEALYAFPLPDDAAVDRLSMRIGERVIEGEIRERKQAERVYAQARDSGQRTSLVAVDKTPARIAATAYRLLGGLLMMIAAAALVVGAANARGPEEAP
jgi:Ca-activated chloride channel family protein